MTAKWVSTSQGVERQKRTLSVHARGQDLAGSQPGDKQYGAIRVLEQLDGPIRDNKGIVGPDLSSCL